MFLKLENTPGTRTGWAKPTVKMGCYRPDRKYEHRRILNYVSEAIADSAGLKPGKIGLAVDHEAELMRIESGNVFRLKKTSTNRHKISIEFDALRLGIGPPQQTVSATEAPVVETGDGYITVSIRDFLTVLRGPPEAT